MNAQDWFNLAFLLGLVWNFWAHMQAIRLAKIMMQWQKHQDDAILKLFGYTQSTMQEQIEQNRQQMEWTKTKIKLMTDLENILK